MQILVSRSIWSAYSSAWWSLPEYHVLVVQVTTAVAGTTSEKREIHIEVYQVEGMAIASTAYPYRGQYKTGVIVSITYLQCPSTPSPTLPSSPPEPLPSTATDLSAPREGTPARNIGLRPTPSRSPTVPRGPLEDKYAMGRARLHSRLVTMAEMESIPTRLERKRSKREDGHSPIPKWQLLSRKPGVDMSHQAGRAPRPKPGGVTRAENESGLHVEDEERWTYRVGIGTDGDGTPGTQARTGWRGSRDDAEKRLQSSTWEEGKSKKVELVLRDCSNWWSWS
ncbi:hypothetical protein EDB87DRAFT_1577465 [Lactarius vividus]|nr:hypothetical protein EDB87DRAFT_1577465 [Lactarius vividus]